METILTAIDHSLAHAWSRFCGDLPGIRIHLGSILDLTCDAVVSPANSFGFMDGGIDALYARHFGPDLQPRLQHLIRNAPSR
jgi:O-acetyl-ADP-ribose deacetylase (regulator of RNase III)